MIGRVKLEYRRIIVGGKGRELVSVGNVKMHTHTQMGLADYRIPTGRV